MKRPKRRKRQLAYEREKSALQRLNLSPEEYQKAIREIANKYGL